MESSVKTCIITGFGINADNELITAFERSGSQVDRCHINDLIRNPEALGQYHIIGFPGGFSFGDHLGSGLVFAQLFRRHLKEALERHLHRGRLIIGICNGFQVLVKMGVLPNLDGLWRPDATLVHNESGRFQDSWVRVEFNSDSPCLWTRGLEPVDMPIRHGEGRFLARDPQILTALKAAGLDAVRYSGGNPNGSQADIAGLTDPTGQILGLMPHPEAYQYPQNHPLWHRGAVSGGEGLALFRQGVSYIREKIL